MKTCLGKKYKKTRLSLEYLVTLRLARGFETIAISYATIYLAMNHVFKMFLKLIYFFSERIYSLISKIIIVQFLQPSAQLILEFANYAHNKMYFE